MLASPARSPPFRSAAPLPPTHPRARSTAALSPHSSPAQTLPAAPSPVATTRSSLSTALDDSFTSAASPRSPASAYTPSASTHAAVDATLLLPEGQPLFPALSSPPVLITDSQQPASLPQVRRERRILSMPSDMQVLPGAGEAQRFSSHLSIDTRPSSHIAAHASPSASPPVVSSPPVTPAYGSDDGQLYQHHRVRRQRQRRSSPTDTASSSSHTASVEVTPSSSNEAPAHSSPLSLHIAQRSLLPSLLAAKSAKSALSQSLSPPPPCEFCDEDAVERAEWYCRHCSMGMCERHKEQVHAKLFPLSAAHQLLELSGHQLGQERRKQERAEADRQARLMRAQEDELRLAKRKQPMRTDSAAALSPFALLQAAPASAADEALRLEIEQNLQHIAEQRHVEEAMLAAAKRADGRSSAGSGRFGRGDARGRLRVLDTPSVTHRFVPLLTKQDVVDNWSRLMDDVAHLYPKPPTKRNGRRSRTPAESMSGLLTSSSSTVLPPQLESNSVQLSHILPIASRLGGRSVSAISPSLRRSALARLSCTPSPPLSPLRWRLEDEERERWRKQQAGDAQHAKAAEEWRQQQLAQSSANELLVYRQVQDGALHGRHYSLAHAERQHELDDSNDSPHSFASSSVSASLHRHHQLSRHSPQEQMHALFARLPPAPAVDTVRSQSSPPRQLEVVGTAVQLHQHGEQEEEEVEEHIWEADEEQSGVEEEKEFLPSAPPALQKQYVTPSYRHDLDLSADEATPDEEAEAVYESERVETEESEMQSVQSTSHEHDEERLQRESEEEREEDERYSDEYDEDVDGKDAEDGDAAPVAQPWEARHHSDPLHSGYVRTPQHRNTGSQTHEQRMAQVQAQPDSEAEQRQPEEADLDEPGEDVASAVVQATPLRLRADDGLASARTPFAPMQRTPVAAATSTAEREADEVESDEEVELGEDEDDESQLEHGQEEEEEEELEDEAALDGSEWLDELSRREEQERSEQAAHPPSHSSLSPRRSPASSFGYHDQDLNDAMWMKSSTDSQQRWPHSGSQRQAADALQLLPSALQAVNEQPLVSLPQQQDRAAILSAARLDEDVLMLAQTLQRILSKRDGRAATYAALPSSSSRHSELDRSRHSASAFASASASLHSGRHQRHRSHDVASASSASRVSLPPHTYPRSSPPVYPVSFHSHSQRLDSQPFHPEQHQQRALHRSTAFASSSSDSSASLQRRPEPSHSGSQHRGHAQATQLLEHTVPPQLHSPLASSATSPLRPSSRARTDSRSSSASDSSSTLDLSHGALRRLDRLLVSHLADQPRKQPSSMHHSIHHRAHTAHELNTRTASKGSEAALHAHLYHKPRAEPSSAAAINVQLQAAQARSILGSMERHRQHDAQQHGYHEKHMPVHRQKHPLQQRPHATHGRRSERREREPVSLASRAYQSMRAGGEEQGGSRRAWN